MTNDATPTGAGPWTASKLGRPQLFPWFVCRQIAGTQWEQLGREDGCGIARFETMTEAQEAAHAANAARPTAARTAAPTASDADLY